MPVPQLKEERPANKGKAATKQSQGISSHRKEVIHLAPEEQQFCALLQPTRRLFPTIQRNCIHRSCAIGTMLNCVCAVHAEYICICTRSRWEHVKVCVCVCHIAFIAAGSLVSIHPHKLMTGVCT